MAGGIGLVTEPTTRQPGEAAGFPIRVLEELTGVPATTLRAWERRHGLLKPKRAPSGHRLYDQQDLARVREVLRLLDANLPIRDAARLVQDGLPAPLPAGRPDNPWEPMRHRLLRAVETFDDGRLDSLYQEALSLYPIDLVTDQLLAPSLRRLGERWRERDLGIAEEHFFSTYLRNKLGSRLHHESQRPRGRRLLLACLPGERHELGLLMFALGTLGRGYRVLYLGPDLPLGQLPGASARAGAAAVILSGTEQADLAPDLPEQLGALVPRLALPLWVGGSYSNAQAQRLAAAGVGVLGERSHGALEQLDREFPAYGGARP